MYLFTMKTKSPVVHVCLCLYLCLSVRVCGGGSARPLNLARRMENLFSPEEHISIHFPGKHFLCPAQELLQDGSVEGLSFNLGGGDGGFL